MYVNHTFDSKCAVDRAHSLSSCWFNDFCSEGCTDVYLMLITNPARISFIFRPDIPDIMQSAENSILLSWDSKGLSLHWFPWVQCRWATSIRENKVTPRAQRNDQKHTRSHPSNSMHSYLSTQISQELRYYGLYAVAVCTIVNQCVEGSWCKQSYTKQRLTPVPSEWTRWRGRTWWSWVETQESQRHHHQVYGEKPYSSKEWMAEKDDGKRRLAGIALFW